jgi:hypothetical protein
MRNSSIEKFIYSCLTPGINYNIKNFNLKDEFIFGSASRKWAWKKFSLSNNKLISYIKKNISKKL